MDPPSALSVLAYIRIVLSSLSKTMPMKSRNGGSNGAKDNAICLDATA